VLVLVASLGALALIDHSSPTSPNASTSPSAGTTAAGAYYPDGIPRSWQGQPVLRGQAALDAANASADATSFYVAFWIGAQWDRACPLAQPGDVFGCGGLDNVGDQPGIVSPVSRLLGENLQVEGSIEPGPVVARVHGLGDSCTYIDPCQQKMVGVVVWNGVDVITPHPVTVGQAAAAFGTTTTSYAPPLDICPMWELPGLPILPFWHTTPTAVPTTQRPDAIVAVFPSPQALAAAAPDAAADGETKKAPGGTTNCQGQGPDQVYWLARANVLVGVMYDPAVGIDASPAVAQAWADIRKLP
jgi:hypothetical protein